jgi:hypothetical protein
MRDETVHQGAEGEGLAVPGGAVKDYSAFPRDVEVAIPAGMVSIQVSREKLEEREIKG